MFTKFRYSKKMNHEIKSSLEQRQPAHNPNQLDKKLETNISKLKGVLGKNCDLNYREIEVFLQTSINVFICYIDGLSNEDSINLHIVKSLMEPNFNVDHYLQSEDIFTVIKKRILSTSMIKEASTMEMILDSILSGETVLFIEGYDIALAISTQGFETRSIAEPETEAIVRGPREGFNEVLKVNTALVRRKINNPKLTFENMTIGVQTKTNIRIGYIEGIANPKVVDEVKRRLKKIKTDIVLESGYIEQLIEDNPYSIFPSIANSERPDKVAAKILEGKVSIFTDGTPFVLTVPCLLIESFQVGEDYYSRPYLASFLRLLRVLALFLTVSTPAIYVALTTFHQEMVPPLLLTTMAAAEEKVPFPVFLESFMLVIIFELLREAGVRMPRPVGSAISIVGALVLGEAAVQAGLVSTPMVIVVGLTGITGFVVTALNDAIILMRFFFLFLAGALGFYGIMMGTLIMLGHLCSLRSFGTPYLAPMGPIILSEWKDGIFRLPLWTFRSRPQSTTWKKSKRQDDNMKPQKPNNNKGGGQN